MGYYYYLSNQCIVEKTNGFSEKDLYTESTTLRGTVQF